MFMVNLLNFNQIEFQKSKSKSLNFYTRLFKKIDNINNK